MLILHILFAISYITIYAYTAILALQLCGTPTLTPNTTSIMVSWTHPHIFPDNYTISYSCQLLCDSLTPSVHTNTVTGQGKASNYTIFSLNAGSSCTVSVTAVFVDGNSNTITSSTNTLIAGKPNSPQLIISDFIAYVIPPSPYKCSKRTD